MRANTTKDDFWRQTGGKRDRLAGTGCLHSPFVAAPVHGKNDTHGPGAELYQPGDVLGGRYEILRKLGAGGFGLVYLAYSRDTRDVLALKTLRDEHMGESAARQAFQREALIWMGLEEHPFILRARWVEVFSGRPFVATDYVAPDDLGRATLFDHLTKARGPLGLEQSLEWAIQFCHGMEHANGHGILCHRDIKPQNIMIMPDGILRITDFGLAVVGTESQMGQISGTPGYIAPELYRREDGSVQSDIYSFGTVLWQMANGSPIMTPFHAVVPRQPEESDEKYGLRFQEAVYQRQMSESAPAVTGPLNGVIQRCLMANPSQRFASFRELREPLAAILRQQTGRSVDVPTKPARGATFWYNRGRSLCLLRRFVDAIECFDRTIAVDPRHADAWNNKGSALRSLGRNEEAIRCFEEAIAIDAQNPYALSNLGCALQDMGHQGEADGWFNRALVVAPRNPYALNHRGASLMDRRRYPEALSCFEQVLQDDPRNVVSWNNKANVLIHLGQYEEALRCCDQALAIDPCYPPAWYNKGAGLTQLGRYEEAVCCCDNALANDPQLADAGRIRGHCLRRLGRFKEAIESLDLVLTRDDQNSSAWYNKGCTLSDMGQYDGAIRCHDRAIEIDPSFAEARFRKAEAESDMGHPCAATSWRKYLEVACDDPSQREWIPEAKRRLADLGQA